MSDFKPRPIRFRVWTGQRMIHQGPSEPLTIFLAHGVPWTEEPRGDGHERQGSGSQLVARDREGWVAMLSTALRDANGVEIFEGDRITFDHDELGAGVVGTVRYYREDGMWMAADLPGAIALHHVAFERGGGRVIGHVFEQVTA